MALLLYWKRLKKIISRKTKDIIVKETNSQNLFSTKNV
jgi:hypothetical protein